MILKMIALSGWRCFLEETSIGPFSDRLNVVFGPNATGKSTLFEALRRALMDSHTVAGQDVGVIRPWGRDLAPRVAVSFAHGGTMYRIAKRFLDGSQSNLEREEGGVFRPLKEGRAADEWVREMLTKNPPGKGLSQFRNWGLAQVLWAPQGEMKLGELSGDLVSDIRSALGAQVADKSSGPVEQKIAEAYSKYFTREGKTKSGKAAPPIVRLQENLDQAKQQRQDALFKLDLFEKGSRRVEELRARHWQLSLEAEEMEKCVNESRRQDKEYRKFKTEFTTRESEIEKVEAQHQQLEQLIKQIKNTEKDLREAEEELARLKSEAPLKRQEVETREKEAAGARIALENARRGEETVSRAEQEADAARKYAELQNSKNHLGDRLLRIEAAERTLAGLRQERTPLVAPDRKTLKAIRKAIQERDEAKLLLDAAMITLEIIPEKEGLLEIVSGEETGLKPLPAGCSTVIQGTPEVIVKWQGVAQLRASGPVGDVRSHRQIVRKQEQAIAQLTAPFGSSDMSRLDELAEKAEHLDRKAGEAAKALETLLADDQHEDLKKEKARLDALLAGMEMEHPGWKTSQPDGDALKRTAADLKRQFNNMVREAEAIWERTQGALTTGQGQETDLLNRLDDRRKAGLKIKDRLADLTRDGKSLSDREEERNRLLLDWDAGKVVLKELKEKLDRFGADPEAALEKLEKSRTALLDSVRETRDEEQKAMGNLEILGAQGPYSVLTQAEEDVARFEEEFRREKLRMDSIRLLHDTVSQCRSEAVASVARPVEEAAIRLFHRIAGRRLERIEMGETFIPSTVLPFLAESPVNADNLSGGEQEQLYLATRLALAQVLARDERQMVVLDDVLTATDTGRLARVLTLLEEAADNLQIIILSCHPERYRALGEAAFFDLEQLMR